MAYHDLIIKRKARLRFLITLLTLALACVPSTLSAAGLTRVAMGSCQVLMDHTSRKGWTDAGQMTFEQCAQDLAQRGEYLNDKWVTGIWSGNDVSINHDGEVYLKDINDTEWEFWGKLTVTEDADHDGVPDAEDKCPDEAEVINNFADNDGCPDSLDELLQAAGKDINEFWQKTFDEHQQDYTPPRRLVPYTSRTASRVHSGCSGVAPGNAMYCPRDHSIYYDVDFLNTLLLTYGDYAPVLVMAHEWGHSIQPQVYGHDGHLSIQIELEADCLAGAYTRYAAVDSQLLEQGDLEEAIANTYAFGDNLPWFDPQAHGSSEQRVTAFLVGLNKGVDACWIP